MRSSQSRTIIRGYDQLSAGTTLIAQRKHPQELLDRSVILLLEHDETGSTGLILNKPCISTSDTGFDSGHIYYGGIYDTHRMGILVKDPGLAKRTVEIRPGLYYSEHSDLLSGKDYHENLIATNTRAFIGFTVWGSGELEKEFTQKMWRSEPFRMNDLEGNRLWDRKVLLSERFQEILPEYSLLLN